jgi:hypothetical protein
MEEGNDERDVLTLSNVIPGETVGVSAEFLARGFSRRRTNS